MGTLANFLVALFFVNLFIIHIDCNCDCIGFKSDCVNENCTCPKNYSFHGNGRDCQQDSCNITDCLECETATLCLKCVHYLAEGRGRCLTECLSHTTFDDNDNGPICIPDDDDDGLSTDVVIGIIAGVSAALLLCIIVLIILCIYYRKTRRKVNLNRTNYAVGNMQAGNVKKVPMYDNQGFDVDNEASLVHNVIDRDVYLRELERLRPHAQTLLTMLNEIRHKLRAMDNSDPRVSTYKGVIHQLCRVLVLVHKKDPGASIPSDALGLMEWAHQMIEDKQLDVEPAEDSLETNPVNRISYIDVPPKSYSNPYATPVIKKPNPYATLNKRNSQLNMSNLSNTSYYSSVPVPVDMDNSNNSQPNHVSVSQNNTLKSTSKENLKRQYEIPWDLKKVSDSYSTLNCSGSDLTMGYFANGRFYDPTPRQQSVKKGSQPEIYAPVCSYSDRSNPPVFSTFAGGVPRNQSFSSQASSSSNTSAHGEEEDEEAVDNNIQDGDGFPFHITDATEPVEV
ncbi:uncharacterized protein LOC132739328 isoform X2 [Ruditapes philippinarum]|uniref:uncharacterized protein LOC132739328 isoform X2 n=1 Tax=Ruditapes philippinarum TaxID=129788 RepID=UPI00295C0C65|nr:uncharacterized protein LOC132739328 isoform X2 [Ruditapes philippinarum]